LALALGLLFGIGGQQRRGFNGSLNVGRWKEWFRMFDHVGVVFKDLKRSGDLYREVLEQIGITLMEDHT
jgi:hypothetical protein